MATALPFLKDGMFEPNDVQAMSMALEDVCKSLNLRDNRQKEVIAERIVDLARRGIRSPTLLRDRVLREAGFAAHVGFDEGQGLTA